jgi:hypothetical protein
MIVQWTFARETFAKKGGTGKECRYLPWYQVPTSILLQENAYCSPETLGRMWDMVSGVQKVCKRDKKLESRTTKKGAKKLVSSNVAKILEKESSNKY